MSTSRSLVVLAVTTWAFIVCFAVWLMFGVTGIPIRRELGLNALEFGLLTSTPVLTGALFRLPLGIWTDRFGGRIVMFLLLIFCAVPVWVSSYASQLWQFLLLGLALGLVGASFAVGTPYVARFFPKERRGFAMGVFGAGTTGAAINMFIAPVLIARYGWQSVPRFYAAALVITAAIFWLLSAPDPGAGKSSALTQTTASGSQGPARMEVLPVLLHRVRRLHGSVRLDAAIFRAGVWFQHCASGAVGCVLFSSRRRAPSSRRMVG